VRKVPGRRIPGTVDPDEMAVRAVLSQQVSLSAAATHAGRLAERLGAPVIDHEGGLTTVFPTAAEIAAMDPSELRLPEARKQTVLALATALADGSLDIGPGAAREVARLRLAELSGIGPWTAEVIAMRALGDPDAFPASDLGVRRAAAAVGLPEATASLDAHSVRWRPWRSYAVQHLWGALDHPINDWPPRRPR
jgi:AraC family transcriptional regulator of adaptative response / DNA-3-methyladenine glycosylase II